MILQNYCIMERWVGWGWSLLQPTAQSGRTSQPPPSPAELEMSKDRDSSLSGCPSQLCATLLAKEVFFCPVQTSQEVVRLTRGHLPWPEEGLMPLASPVCLLVYELLSQLPWKRSPSSKIIYLWPFITSPGTSCLHQICWLVINHFPTGFNSLQHIL